MDLIGYISLLSSRALKTTLKPGEQKFLLNLIVYEANQGPFSPYDIFSYLKRQGKGMAYKNVRKYIELLQEYGFLKKARRGKRRNVHKAQFRCISPSGWVYVWGKLALQHFLGIEILLTRDDPRSRLGFDQLIPDTFLYGILARESIGVILKNMPGVIPRHLQECSRITIDHVGRGMLDKTDKNGLVAMQCRVALKKQEKVFIIRLMLEGLGSWDIFRDYPVKDERTERHQRNMLVAGSSIRHQIAFQLARDTNFRESAKRVMKELEEAAGYLDKYNPSNTTAS